MQIMKKDKIVDIELECLMVFFMPACNTFYQLIKNPYNLENYHLVNMSTGEHWFFPMTLAEMEKELVEQGFKYVGYLENFVCWEDLIENV